MYTNETFKEVQREILGMICCNYSLMRNDGVILTYEVFDTVQIDDFTKDVRFCVYCNCKEFELKCTCGLFETRGILCRHDIFVFRLHKSNTSLPSMYILDRWRNDLKCKYTLIKSSYDDLSNNSDTRRHDHLMRLFCEVAPLVLRSEELYNRLVDHLTMAKEECRGLMCEQRTSKPRATTNGIVNKGKKVLNPNMVRGKGRPPTRRRVSTVEKSVKNHQSRKKRDGDSNDLNKKFNANLKAFYVISSVICCNLTLMFNFYQSLPTSESNDMLPDPPTQVSIISMVCFSCI